MGKPRFFWLVVGRESLQEMRANPGMLFNNHECQKWMVHW